MLSEEFENKQPRANVVNGGLVLSYPNAMTPVLWRHSLDKMDDVSFQLLFEGNISILAIKTSTGHLKEIARFATSEEGEKAMQLANDALFTGGSSNFLLNDSPSSGSNIFAISNIVVLILLIGVLWFGYMVYSQYEQQEQPIYVEQQSALVDSISPEDNLAAGQAVDVDELFAQ